MSLECFGVQTRIASKCQMFWANMWLWVLGGKRTPKIWTANYVHIPTRRKPSAKFRRLQERFRRSALTLSRSRSLFYYKRKVAETSFSLLVDERAQQKLAWRGVTSWHALGLPFSHTGGGDPVSSTREHSWPLFPGELRGHADSQNALAALRVARAVCASADDAPHFWWRSTGNNFHFA